MFELPNKLVFPIAFLMLAAMVPMTTVAAPSCHADPPEEETAKYPLRGDVYIFFAKDGASGKTGFWQETNTVGGLQTEECRVAGNKVYTNDRFLGYALP